MCTAGLVIFSNTSEQKHKRKIKNSVIKQSRTPRCMWRKCTKRKIYSPVWHTFEGHRGPSSKCNIPIVEHLCGTNRNRYTRRLV